MHYINQKGYQKEEKKLKVKGYHKAEKKLKVKGYQKAEKKFVKVNDCSWKLSGIKRD